MFSENGGRCAVRTGLLVWHGGGKKGEPQGKAGGSTTQANSDRSESERLPEAPSRISTFG